MIGRWKTSRRVLPTLIGWIRMGGWGACQILLFWDSQVIPYKARGLHWIDVLIDGIRRCKVESTE